MHTERGQMSRQFAARVEKFVKALDDHPGEACIKACEALDDHLGKNQSYLTVSQISVSLITRVLVSSNPDNWNVVISAIVGEAVDAAEKHLGLGETRH